MNCNVCKQPIAGPCGPCLACVEKLKKSGKTLPTGLPKRAWVLCKRTKKEFLFITIHGRLPLFSSREDAQAMLPVLKEGDVDISDIVIEEVPADVCWAYTVLAGLELGVAVRSKAKLN